MKRKDSICVQIFAAWIEKIVYVCKSLQHEEKMQFSNFTHFAPKIMLFQILLLSFKNLIKNIRLEPFKLNSIVNDVFERKTSEIQNSL